MKVFIIIPLCLMLAGCPTTRCEPPTISPLVVANCTDLQPPADDSFGATTYSLITTVGQYRKCQAAALGEAKKKPAD